MMPNSVADEVHSFMRLPVPDDAGGIASLDRGCPRAYGQCYVTPAGKAFCWGDNDFGQIAASFDIAVPTPAAIDLPANKKVVDISVGGGQTCAVLDDGTVYCWGSNARSECARTASATPAPPAAVPGITNAAMVAPGIFYFSCALTTDHKTFCWGDGSFGQLGTTDAGGNSVVSIAPVEIPIAW